MPARERALGKPPWSLKVSDGRGMVGPGIGGAGERCPLEDHTSHATLPPCCVWSSSDLVPPNSAPLVEETGQLRGLHCPSWLFLEGHLLFSGFRSDPENRLDESPMMSWGAFLTRDSPSHQGRSAPTARKRSVHCCRHCPADERTSLIGRSPDVPQPNFPFLLIHPLRLISLRLFLNNSSWVDMKH